MEAKRIVSWLWVLRRLRTVVETAKPLGKKSDAPPSSYTNLVKDSFSFVVVCL